MNKLSSNVDGASIKLLKSTTVVSLMTLLSRVFGLLRDIVLAWVFGASAQFDAFVVAFKLPNFMRRLFAEGAFSQAFVPVLSEYRGQRAPSEVKDFLNHMAGLLGLVLTVFVILVEIAAPLVMMVFAPGFMSDAARYQDAVHLLRITFPYLLLIALSAFSGAILNTYSRFGPPAFTPVLLNVVMISVAVSWAPHTAMPVQTLAWGVLIGGVAQLLWQMPFLYRLKRLPVPKFFWRDSGVRRVLTLMIPALFGVSVAQISLLIDNFFASFLQAGSISWLYYSDRLIYLPQGVVGVALATVVLPSLSRHHAAKERIASLNTLNWALRMALLMGLPAAFGLFLLATPILTTLIYHGAFSASDVAMTASSLRAFTLGLPAFMIIKIAASAFYAQQNMKEPVKIAAIAVLVNLLLDVALVYPFAHVGLALATSITAMVNALLLMAGLYRAGQWRWSWDWGVWMLRLLVANAVMVLLLIALAPEVSQWFVWSLWSRVWHLIVIVIIGIVSYALTLLLCGLRWQTMQPR